MKGLLYASLTVAWLVALRREAARLRWLRWLDGWCLEVEEFAADRIAAAARVWVPVSAVPDDKPLPRMTAAGDATTGMTLQELLEDAP